LVCCAAEVFVNESAAADNAVAFKRVRLEDVFASLALPFFDFIPSP
jgi:hypothetical protein